MPWQKCYLKLNNSNYSESDTIKILMDFFNYVREVFGAKEPPVFKEYKPEVIPEEPKQEPIKMLTEIELKKFSPKTPDNLIPVVCKWFNYYAEKFEVNTPERIAYFLSQLIHESIAFKALRENDTGASYEGRKDLGNIYKGDGVKFKGRGYIQVTGRSNYGVVSKFIFGDNRLLTNPDLLATPQFGMLSAFWYWESRELNKYADYPVGYLIKTKKYGFVYPFFWLTVRINGGINGLQDRINNYNRIATILNLPLYPKN